MVERSPEQSSVNARIIYWGIEGAGKTQSLHAVQAKLRPDHRGELRQVPTRIDPTVHYEVLPIELGEVAGVRTQIQLVAAPGGPEQAPTRKQLLDRVDGVVFVVDSRSERLDENLASLEELRSALEDYGRTLEDLPVVIQYNKRDLADPYGIEALHRKLDLPGSAVFEAVATEHSGVLQALSTISKRVVRTLRDRPELPDADAAEPAAAAPAPPEPESFAPQAPPLDEVLPNIETQEINAADLLEEAILEEADHPDSAAVEEAAQRAHTLLDEPWQPLAGELQKPSGVRLGADLVVVSVGEATRCDDHSVRIPLVVGDAEGNTSTLQITLRIDALCGDDDTG